MSGAWRANAVRPRVAAGGRAGGLPVPRAPIAAYVVAFAIASGACHGSDDEAPGASQGTGGAGSAGSGIVGVAGHAGGGEGEGGGQSAGMGGKGGSAPSEGAGGGGSGPGGGAGATGTEGVGGAITGGAAGDGGASGAGGSTPPPTPWYDCQASDQAFVRRAITAALGRRPLGQAEVNVYSDLVRAVDVADGFDPSVPTLAGADLKHSRRVLLAALTARPEFASYWQDVFRDGLRVQRLQEDGGQANPECFGTRARKNATPALAQALRDAPPAGGNADGGGAFTMSDVIASSIALDDVSPMYVGNLFAMLALTYPGANAAPDKLELARRSDFGAWFDAVYLHRDVVCLACHNSEASVTYDPDPVKNRFFPLPALLEKPLFGVSSGPPDAGGYDGVTRAHAVLRYDGFVDAGDAKPWGWSAACGSFAAADEVAPDIAGVDAKFGNIKGTRATAWDTSASLQAGFAKLRAHGLTRLAGDEVPDPDEAFAYLVSANVAEFVWQQTVGTPLTIANYFPRNQAARDQLLTLTEGFIASGFSHTYLLQLVMQSPYFNLLSPDAGCGPSAYPAPDLFDPWVKADDDPGMRGNGPSDGVAALTSRAAMHAAYAALEWAPPPDGDFPYSDGDEADFQSAIGIFLKNAEPGFRGFDFQARLGWEERMGSCQNPSGASSPDFIKNLVTGLTPGAFTVGDLVVALKDRLTGDATIDVLNERLPLETVVGASLDGDAAATPSVEQGLRRICGVLIASPQFLLTGVTASDATGAPKATPKSSNYDAICAQLASTTLPDGLGVACTESSLRLTTQPH